VYSLFHLQIVEFNATMSLCYQLYGHRLWFSNIPIEKNQEYSSQVNMKARKLELHVCNQSSIQDVLQSAIDTS
jgi:hypothetical protein